MNPKFEGVPACLHAFCGWTGLLVLVCVATLVQGQEPRLRAASD